MRPHVLLIGENKGSKRKTGDSHSRMRTEEKLESAMVEQRVLEIQGCGFSVLFAARFEISLGAILTQTRLNYSLHIFAPVKQDWS